jgi:hypothetical protein
MSSNDYYGGGHGQQQNYGYDGAQHGQQGQGYNQGYPPQGQGYAQQPHDQYGASHSPYPPQGQVRISSAHSEVESQLTLTRAHTNPRRMIHTSSKATALPRNTSMTSLTIPAAATLPTHLRNNTRDTKIHTSSKSAMASTSSQDMASTSSKDMASTSSKAMGSRRHTVRHSMASLERLAALQKVIAA